LRAYGARRRDFARRAAPRPSEAPRVPWRPREPHARAIGAEGRDAPTFRHSHVRMRRCWDRDGSARTRRGHVPRATTPPRSRGHVTPRAARRTTCHDGPCLAAFRPARAAPGPYAPPLPGHTPRPRRRARRIPPALSGQSGTFILKHRVHIHVKHFILKQIGSRVLGDFVRGSGQKPQETWAKGILI